MNFKFEFTENEVRLLGQALMELPTKYGMPLLENIQKQVNAQLPEQPTKVTEPSPLVEESTNHIQ